MFESTVVVSTTIVEEGLFDNDKLRSFDMDQQTLLRVLTEFTFAQRQMLLTLELLMNVNKHLLQTPFATRNRIRQFAYFRMIHESDLVCRESTHINRRIFAILCHLLRTVAGLSSMEIVDVEKMVAMFLHVLAHDDALDRENGLQMPKGYYYVCDVGYPNAKGFLAPYRGQRYHLQDWWGDGNAPTTAKEYFNMKHSLAINVIECAFVVLKDRWAILRGKSYYPL
ncbi:putative nuclease HARBI1 [Cucumis melo var. makuwa]|uniref:Nuclease HARBI1 n=1 Tax=Cucumis melo var. makuwa TaxID=1194695 RepID=A0A5D3D5J9_CUCMM|nr:putative nuclease HARBI1 [Cucumis melo var. makuwa]TYK18795.1 putative nuclease HARBI1 [Cucumis melo var. makuwa]